MRVLVSLPAGPNEYPGNSSSWPQICHFIFKALKANFANVKAIPFGPYDLRNDDLLITCVPNPNLIKWKRSIIIDNDNFSVDKWKHGRFKRYGLNYQTDHTFKYNQYLNGILAAFWKTNDQAIKRWHSDHPLIKEKKDWLQAHIKNNYLFPHPIDKKFFSRHYNDKLAHKPKMLIYHTGWRKNASQLIEMLKKLGYQDRFKVVSNIVMNDKTIKNLIEEYPFIAHVSISEGFPYLANELMCQGMVLYGHEDWWDGYDNNMLLWTYDPKKQKVNENRLKKIFSLNPTEIQNLRKSMWSTHMSRKDNEWSYLTNKLIEEVKRHV